MPLNPRQLGLNELVKALTDRDPENRRIAAGALGDRRMKRAVPPLIATLKDEVPAVRKAAAVSLGLLQAPLAIEPLLKTLKDGNPDVRNEAAGALAMIHDPRAIDAMIFTLIRDPESQVRNLAILALHMCDYTGNELITDELEIKDDAGYGRLADAYEHYLKGKGIADLLKVLADERLETYVRSRAAFGLGLICDREAVDPLRAAAAGDQAELVKQANSALERIKKRFMSGREPAFSLRNVLGAELVSDEDITEVTGREPARGVVKKGLNFLKSLGKRLRKR